MKKQITGKAATLLVCFCCIFLFKIITVNAAMAEGAEDYELGEIYEGNMEYSEEARYFKFNIPEKSHVTLYFRYRGKGAGGSIFNSVGKEVLRRNDMEFKTNFFTGYSSGELSRTLSAGTYYLEIQNHGKWKWQEYRFSFWIQAEKQINLAKGSFRSLRSEQKGQMEVKCYAAQNAIGYRIQYSTDYRFKKQVKTVYSPTTAKIIPGLKPGKRYYVKVCPYTVYDDGTHVFGQNSYVKAVVIKKK